jgi:hypothetical protein
VQNPCQGNVIDIVPGRLREFTALPPACHTAVHQTRIAVKAHLWAQSQTLHHSGSEPFQKHVCAGDQVEDQRNPRRFLEVDCDRTTTPVAHIAAAFSSAGPGSLETRLSAVYPQYICPEVAEHHRGERPRGHA